MLHGYVDEVSRRSIKGWAADDEKPDDAIEISVFIDGVKVAQVLCDRLRGDLAETGQYGNGRHGFSYGFSHAFTAAKDTRLSVRYSRSGASLTRGECILSEECVQVLPDPPALPDDEPVTLPAPSNQRQLFELLALYDERFGLAPLLSRLDIDNCYPRDLHYAVLDRLPDTCRRFSDNDRFYPRDYLQELLLDPSFQADILPFWLKAYADKQRLIFLHIPKCAGTDLSNKLKTRYPWLDFNIMDPDWMSKDAMLRHLSRLAVHLRFADAIYLCGHATPNYYRSRGLVRPMDRVFTIVRHPFDTITSQVNYVLTRFWSDAKLGKTSPDTREWLELIGIDALPARLSDDFVTEVGKRVLWNTDIVKPNSLCYWLAGNRAGASAALDVLMVQNVEVTDTSNYGNWLAQRWNIRSETRDNASTKFLHMAILSPEDQDYVRGISVEDRKLFEIIERSIAHTGKPSVMGQEVLHGAD